MNLLKEYVVLLLPVWLAEYLLAKLLNDRAVKKWFLSISAVIYGVVALYVTLAGREPMADMHAQLELLWEYRQAFAFENGQLSVQSLWLNMIVNNILLFVPLGIFLSEAFQKGKHRFIQTIVTGILASVLVEITQLVFRLGLFEVDDILNNGLGTVLGYYASILAEKLAAAYKMGTGD